MKYPGRGFSTADTSYPEVDYQSENVYVLDIERLKTCDEPVFFVTCHSLRHVRFLVDHIKSLFTLHSSKQHNFLFDVDNMDSDTTEYPLRFIAVVEDEDPDREHRVTIMLQEAAEFQAAAAPLRLLSNLLQLEEDFEDEDEVLRLS